VIAPAIGAGRPSLLADRLGAECAEAGSGQGSYVRESFEVATADMKLQLEVAIGDLSERANSNF